MTTTTVDQSKSYERPVALGISARTYQVTWRNMHISRILFSSVDWLNDWIGCWYHTVTCTLWSRGEEGFRGLDYSPIDVLVKGRLTRKQNEFESDCLSPQIRIDKEMNFNWICIYEASMNIIINTRSKKRRTIKGKLFMHRFLLLLGDRII